MTCHRSMCALAIVAAIGMLAFAAGAAVPIKTNICSLDWNYCPRDPGCKTYTMSVHDVNVHANGMDHVEAYNLKAGTSVTVEVTGITTMKSVSDHGSYRIYGLSGHNVAAGVLADVLTLDGDQFTLEITFTLTSDTMSADFFEFGIDVFQAASGTDEGMCVEIADRSYVAYEEAKVTPPFVMMCKDDGNGHFTPDVHRIHPKPIAAPACDVPPPCDLNWFYCPRDPGCITYTMSVGQVQVDVQSSTLEAGDKIVLHVNGTTSMRSIPAHGSFRIYDLQGHNVAAGILLNTLSLSNCNTQGCDFAMVVPFTLSQGDFDGTWFDFTLDVFQEASGTDEGMCVQISNPAYAKYLAGRSDPKFDILCQPHPYGHFTSDTMPDPVYHAICNMS